MIAADGRERVDIATLIRTGAIAATAGGRERSSHQLSLVKRVKP
jgi:hypothetical protein